MSIESGDGAPGEGTPVEGVPAEAVAPPAPQPPAIPQPVPPSAPFTPPPVQAASGPTSVSTATSAEVLQSMLSRAAEGQVNEQRELTGAITDMRNQLMRVTQELAELRVRPADETTDAQANNLTVEIRESVRFLSERLDGVARMVAQRGEELADIRIALTAIDAHVRSQAETIGVLSAGLQALPSYGERVSGLQDLLQQIAARIVSIERSMDANRPGPDPELVERLVTIESSLAPLSAQAEQLSQLQSTSSRLQQAVTGMVASLSGVQDSVAGVHERIEPLTAGAGAVDNGDLDTKIATSMTSAVRDTEQRLMAHIDEAVMALAETLLRRRGSTPAGAGAPAATTDAAKVPLDGGAVGSALGWPADASTEPAGAPSLDPASADLVDTMPAVESTDAAVAESHELESGPPLEASEDVALQVRVPDEPVEATDVAAEPTEAVDESDEAADVATESEQPASHEWGAFAQELLDAAPTNFVKSDAAESWESDDPATATPHWTIEPDGTDPAPDSSPRPPEAWTPQTPPARDPADPTLNVGEEKKKRRWGRNK